MAVRDDWQGKGAATALLQAAIDLADKWLNLTRLELEVYTDNEPAIRLYRSLALPLKVRWHSIHFEMDNMSIAT